MTPTGVEATTTELVNKRSPSWPKWQYYWAELWVLICTVHLTVCSWYVAYAFESESTLNICLNVKELLARNRRNIWSLSDWNVTRTHNYLVRKGTLKHLAKLTKWFSCIVSNYLYGAFDCMFSSYDVRVSEWIYTLYLTESQGTSCWNQARYLKIKWLRQDSNPQSLSS